MRGYVEKTRTKWELFAVSMLILFGMILVIDELWMFGIPVGHILPDLSWVDGGNPYVHHWMLGLLLIFGGSILYEKFK